MREGQEAVSAIWYEPDGYNGEDKLLVFVYIHGDAWISTDAVDVDTYMQDIADGTPCKVVEGTIDCETKQRSSFNCCAVKSNLLEAPQSGPLLIMFAVD